MDHRRCLVVFILLSLLLRSESWGWFSSSEETPSSDRTYANGGNFRGSSAEFSTEAFNNRKGIQLTDNAKQKMISSNSCWQNAYQNLFAGCSEILAVDEKRSRLAWHLSDCFQRDSGRSPFPQCDAKASVSVCLRTLDDLAHKVYLEFYLETNTICYQLQAHAFKLETERLVTELKSSAQYVEDKLDSIEEKSEHLLKDSKQIHDSLEDISKDSKQIHNSLEDISKDSKQIHNSLEDISKDSKQIHDSLEDVKRNLEDGVTMLKDSYNYLGKEIENVKGNLQDGVAMVKDSYSYLGKEIENVKGNLEDGVAIVKDSYSYLSKEIENVKGNLQDGVAMVKDSYSYLGKEIENVKGNLEDGVAMVKDSYSYLGKEIENVKGNLEDGVAMVKDSYSYLGKEIENVKGNLEDGVAMVKDSYSYLGKEIEIVKGNLEDGVAMVKDSYSYLGKEIENVKGNLEDGVAMVKDSYSYLGKEIENVKGNLEDGVAMVKDSYSYLSKEIENVKGNLKDGVAMVKDSYNYLGKEIKILRDEAIEIENKVIKVGDAMSSKMNSLQSKAEDIGNMAGISLDKQQQLLDGQSTALEGLNSLTEFQSKALEESRKTLQYFAEYGQRQHEEFLQREEQIQGFHDRLMENSKSILSSQASMVDVLDRIFALQNALLLESRMIKAFFIYFISIFVIFMLTSTKQTYNIRPFLYIELCATFLLEVLIIRLTSDNIEHQTWIINFARLSFVVAASVQLLHAIWTYKDYETLNHQMLLTLINKVNSMEKQKELSWDVDTDYEDWSQWVDADLPDDVNCLDDPDYILPEEVAENSMMVAKTYNLRHRNLFH